jgi:hypothetical protein
MTQRSARPDSKVLLPSSRRTNGTYSNMAFAKLYDGTTPLGQLDDES